MLSSIEEKYLSSNSIVHKFNSTFKVISFIILLIGAFFINSFEDIIMLSSYLILSLVNSGINIKYYLKKLSNYIIFFLIILIIDIIALNSTEIIVCDLFRLLYIVSYIILFVCVTTINEIIYGLERVTDPLHIKRDSNIILYIALLFRFPSILTREIIRIIRICKERRIIKNKTLKEKITIYISILSKSFNSSINKLNNMFIIMKMYLYGYGKSRTNYRLNSFSIREWLILGLEIVILTIVIFY